jgi:predicted O-linked N-acetylglucosamine transferase (SPINDLY family)
MAAGLGDWVANSLQEYAEKLDRLIRQPQERLKIRDYLTDTRDASALFNIAKFTRQFEAAIEQIVAH